MSLPSRQRATAEGAESAEGVRDKERDGDNMAVMIRVGERGVSYHGTFSYESSSIVYVSKTCRLVVAGLDAMLFLTLCVNISFQGYYSFK